MVMSVKGQGQGQLSGQPLRWDMFISNFNLIHCRILVRIMSIYYICVSILCVCLPLHPYFVYVGKDGSYCAFAARQCNK